MRSRWVDRPMVFRMQTAAKAVVMGRDGTAPRNRKRYSIRLADLRWKSSLRSILFQATSITLNYSYRAPTIGQCVITRTIDTCCCCCCCYQFIPRIACGFPFFSCLLNVEWRGLFFLDAQLSGSEQKKKKEGMTHCYLLTAKMGGSRFRSMGFITMNTCWFLCSRPAGSRNAYVITEHCNYFVFFFFFILIIIRKKERKIMHTALQ